MPEATDITFPQNLRSRGDDFFARRIEPVAKYLPHVGPHVSDSSVKTARRVADFGLEVVGVQGDDKQRVLDLIGTEGPPPFAVHTLTDEQTPAEGQPDAAHFDPLHTRRYDP